MDSTQFAVDKCWLVCQVSSVLHGKANNLFITEPVRWKWLNSLCSSSWKLKRAVWPQPADHDFYLRSDYISTTNEQLQDNSGFAGDTFLAMRLCVIGCLVLLLPPAISIGAEAWCFPAVFLASAAAGLLLHLCIHAFFLYFFFLAPRWLLRRRHFRVQLTAVEPNDSAAAAAAAAAFESCAVHCD